MSIRPVTVFTSSKPPGTCIRMYPGVMAQCRAIQQLIRPAETADLLRMVPAYRIPSGYSLAEHVARWLAEKSARGELVYASDPDDGFDYWCSPARTRWRGEGDCDDLAILAASILRAGGVDAWVVTGTLWNGYEDGGHAWVEGEDRSGFFLIEATSGKLYRYRPSAYTPNLVLAPGVCHVAA